MPEMHRVESSWVAAIGYDTGSEEIHVELIEGSLYAYLGVHPAVWHTFVAAASKGTFVNEVLKPGYRFRQLRGSWPAR